MKDITTLKQNVDSLKAMLDQAHYNELLAQDGLAHQETNWETIARLAYSIGSALLDRHVQKQERTVETKLITGSLFTEPEPKLSYRNEDSEEDQYHMGGMDECGGCGCGD